MDVARFGDWATMSYTNAKVRENYSRRFRIRFPNEELPAARPLRMTPVYDRLKAQGAVFGAAFGLEHPLWFAPLGTEAREDVTYRRSNAHAPVGAECRAVREAVGLSEISSFAKYEVTGSGAGAWLERMLANTLPREGRLTLSPMLNDEGKLIGDFTVANAGRDRFFVFGSGIAEQYHLRWFEAHLPPTGVAIRALRTELLGLGIAGPKARELLSRVCRDDVSNAALPFLSFRALDVAMLPARVGRISFTGELGYEIWVPADCQLALYEALVAAGADLGLVHFGARALNSLRLEKSFGNWAREYRPIYTPGGSRARALRRRRETGLRRSRGCAAGSRARPGAAARDVRGRRRRRRRDRRRAGVARRQGRRLGHLRRVRALRGEIDRAGLRAGGACARRERVRNRDPGRTPHRIDRTRAAPRSGGHADAALVAGADPGARRHPETLPPMIGLNDLGRHHAALRGAIDEAIARVRDRGVYVLGPEVAAFEGEFAAYCGAGECVAVGNGTDALELALRALGIGAGDEVATAANAGGYATSAILGSGAVPVYADVVDATLQMDPAALAARITPRTRAVVVTHLYGRLADVDALASVARERGIALVEDCAQAHGASRRGRKAGTFGVLGCFSFYPSKNLGALGDAGAVVTGDAALAARVRELRMYGWREKYHCAIPGGMNSRMDELQAAVLRVMLPCLDAWNRRRREIAECYTAAISHPAIRLPAGADPGDGAADVAHLYVVRTAQRERLRAHLAAADVATGIHFPVPDHRQAARPGLQVDPGLECTERACAEVVSLPCYPELTEDEMAAVAAACNRWQPAG